MDALLNQVKMPWPPTVNTYWRSRAAVSRRTGKKFVNVYLSPKAKEYRVLAMGALGLRRRKYEGLVSLGLVLHPPDVRRRDIDNVLKPLLDCLVHCKVIADDDQVKRLQAEMCDPTPGGLVYLTVAPIEARSSTIPMDFYIPQSTAVI